MLKLSYSHDENNFAIPREKYILKTNSSSDLEIMTYLGNGEFKRDLFGYNVQGLPNYKIESDDSIERYIVPLDAIIEAKSYKDLMEKGKSKYKKSYSFFIKVIRKEFNKLDKVFAEFIDEKDDVISDETELKTLLEHQLDLSKDNSRKEYIARMCNKLYS